MDFVASGNPTQGKWGQLQFACTTSSDCYGAETCDLAKRTCVCSMFSPREQVRNR